MNGFVYPNALGFALAYAKRGWHVFPCYAAIAGSCSCGRANCKNSGKHPRTKNGLKNATIDAAQISRWFRSNVDDTSNVAIATGTVSNLVVIDIDPRHGGDTTLATLEGLLSPLPRGFSIRTGGNGCHIYLRAPEDVAIRSRNGWRQGIDVKGEGGYVLSAPSVHKSGRRYEWINQYGSLPPEIPADWIAALTDQVKTGEINLQNHPALLQRAHKYAANVPGANEGTRNDAAFKLAGHIAALIDRGDRLDESEIRSVVASWNNRCRPPLEADELECCIASALRNGTPRIDKEAIAGTMGDAQSSSDGGEPTEPRKSQATQLVELASGVELFHDPDGNGFARFPVDQHFEVAGARNKRFRTWLARMFFLAAGKTPSSQAMQDAIGVLEGKAIFEGPKRTVHVRVAGDGDKIYVDLCNEQWQVVEITASGWRVLNESPVMFRRPKAMLPLPVPVKGGSIDELRQFVHMEDSDWALFLGWLVAAFRSTGPYPVLDLQGEHGSGKSTACRMARALVDPNTAPLRSEPREPRDLMIAANNGWVIALDNLSGIQAWQSDCLCRLSTGGGFSTRTLYENDEETIFDATRPVIINGIEEVATRADLLDRCLLLNLPRIEQIQRRPEAELWQAFEDARPRILGALFSAVAAALRNLPTTNLPVLPRMADFAIWATAAEPALGLAPGTFLATYQSNRNAGNEVALESSPVGKAVMDFVAEISEWKGTSTELLEQLESRAEEKTKRLDGWPKGARALSGAMKRLAPNLRTAGVGVEFRRDGRKSRKLIELSRQQEEGGNFASAATDATAPPESSEFDPMAAVAIAVANRPAVANDVTSSSADHAAIYEEFEPADATVDAVANLPSQSDPWPDTPF
jgi:hypothetical protein